MFQYKVVFTINELEITRVTDANSSDDALAEVFVMYPEASNVRLWRDNVVSLITPDNVIYVDFKKKVRIA